MAYGRPNMGGMNQQQMMKQARKLQEQMLAAQAKLGETEFSASTGGGAVKVSVTGDMRVKSISIDPEAVDLEDIEILEDMIIAAVNDAIESAEAGANQQMSSLTGGLNIPGLF